VIAVSQNTVYFIGKLTDAAGAVPWYNLLGTFSIPGGIPLIQNYLASRAATTVSPRINIGERNEVSMADGRSVGADDRSEWDT
jgi:hypothetical protein